MRVDFTAHGPQAPDNRETSRAAQSPANPVPTNPTAGMDQTRFSFDQARVQSLEAQVLAQPEIRQQKVSSIQRLLVTGRYQISDQQIAQAMVTEWADWNLGK